MNTQEIIAELPMLNRQKLEQVDAKLHDLLEAAPVVKTWGEALSEVAGTVDGPPPDYSENHDHYLHGLPRR